MPEQVVGEHTVAAVPLEAALAHLQQEAQVLVVKEPFPVKEFHFFQVGRLPVSAECGYHPFLTVKAIEYLPHELLECVLVERVHRRQPFVSRMWELPPPMRAL